MADRDAARAVHEALTAYLEDGEIPVCWTLTIEVAAPDGRRYLAHRSGGGYDGADAPSMWTALGMLRSDVLQLEDQIREATSEPDDDAGDLP